MALGARLRSHFSLSGRMSARDYRRLNLRLVYLSALVLAAGIFIASQGIPIAGYVTAALVAALWLVNSAAFVRRAHDRNRTGLWILFAVLTSFLSLYLEESKTAAALGSTNVTLFQCGIVLTNLWLMIELYVLSGTPGTNRFGLDPRHDGAVASTPTTLSPEPAQ